MLLLPPYSNVQLCNFTTQQSPQFNSKAAPTSIYSIVCLDLREQWFHNVVADDVTIPSSILRFIYRVGWACRSDTRCTCFTCLFAVNSLHSCQFCFPMSAAEPHTHFLLGCRQTVSFSIRLCWTSACSQVKCQKSSHVSKSVFEIP